MAESFPARTARKEMAERRRFSVPQEECRAWRERTLRKPSTLFESRSVELVHPSPVSDAIVQSPLKARPGPLDLPHLQADVKGIASIGELDLVDWRIARRDGGYVLRIVVKDRAWGRTSAGSASNSRPLSSETAASS